MLAESNMIAIQNKLENILQLLSKHVGLQYNFFFDPEKLDLIAYGLRQNERVSGTVTQN